MAYVKKYKTKEERSAAMAAAGRKGALTCIARGHCRGGRKPALKCDTDPTTTCTIRESDSRFITRMSFELGIAKAACIRVLILQYRELHPEIKCADEDEAKIRASIAELARFITTKTGTDSKPNC